ncbi:RNA-directed DNA polymerase, eukaryota, reverse transcriptase zinc-binding domain protein [Tanacetum coccineum]
MSDIQKAYDTVNWDFLMKTLTLFGFPNQMVKWIMTCVSTTTFSINVNGEKIKLRKVQNSDIDPVKVLKEALDEFNMICRLVPNMGKSTVFFRNLKNLTKQEIIDVMPFKVGSFPVTYFGVPLITKQIGIESNSSCGWKQILNSSIWDVWHDNWSGKGPLSALIGQEALKHQSINTMDKTFSGLVSNTLESSGCDYTHLVVFSFPAWPWEEVGLE